MTLQFLGKANATTRKSSETEKTIYLTKFLDGNKYSPEVSKHKIPASCKTTIHEFYIQLLSLCAKVKFKVFPQQNLATIKTQPYRISHINCRTIIPV